MDGTTETRIASLTPETANVGDGASVCGYTDIKAYTIIAKTATTITLQRDEVTRLTQPEFVPGGFLAHCTNQNKIKYSYKPDSNGHTLVARWSKKRGYFFAYGAGGDKVLPGRTEFYDYNF